MSKEEKQKKEPSVGMSFGVFFTAIAIILVGALALSFDLHICLLLALGFVCIVSGKLGYSFDDQVEFMKQSISQAFAAMIIFIFIGIIVASWIFSGTVPSLIYYGLQYINPSIFLTVGLLLCSITSLSIGTSWGTIGTMGLAMMGIGQGMGIPAGITAGMVISGAAFGDKMSPISDTTNLAPAAAGATLSDHIAAMTKTTIPAYIITLIGFTVIGFQYKDNALNMDTINVFTKTLSENFVISPILLIPIIVLLVLNLLRFPAIPGMAVGSLIAVVLAVFVQGTPVAEVVAGLNYGYSTSTGVDIVDTLICRGGIQNMMYTFSLSCIAISFGGVMEHVGYLHKIVNVIIGKVKNDAMLVPVVIASTTIGTLTMSEVYLSLVVNGNLYRETFKERGLKPEMLSRLLEEGGTLTQYFVPWSTTSVFVLGTLGVSTAQYWKFALLNYINPIVSIVFALFGIAILRVNDQKKKK